MLPAESYCTMLISNIKRKELHAKSEYFLVFMNNNDPRRTKVK